FAGAGLDQHAVAVDDQLARAFGGQADAIFVILDFPGGADDHGRSPIMDVIGDRHAAENLSALLAEMPREVLAYVGRIREQGAQISRETGQGRTMIDRIDAKLLDLLHRTGPRPAAELGDIVGLSASACHRRIRALEAAGIITGYAARLDPERIGLGL